MHIPLDPAPRPDRVRSLLAIVAKNGSQVFQMDVKSTFLNFLQEEMQVEQPEGLMIKGKKVKYIC